MKLKKIKLRNFRCFGETEQIIEFNNLTTLIGNNSSGKTSVLRALNLLFSENPSDRILQRNDFFVPKDILLETFVKQELYIETVFSFEELEGNSEQQRTTIPPFFSSLVTDEPGGNLFLRIRLEALWEKDSSVEGAIEYKINFITCPESAEILDINRKNARRLDLNRIRMIYVPAVRDPSKQLKNVSGTMMYQIMNSINWSENTKKNIKNTIETLNTEFIQEKGVAILKKAVHDQWKDYDSDYRYSDALLRFNSTDIDSAVKQSEVIFSPTATGKEYSIDEMGDGLRSLFYISMVNSILDVEDTIRKEKESDVENLSFSKTPPLLTIVAIEEPENHISPHLIGKLINKLNNISKKNNSQTIITSHSPSIVKRVSAENLRYFRLVPETLSTDVRAITLPNKEKLADQYKYIKEAVTAYPEIYFAKLVVLGEGDSEEIILPRFFERNGSNIDTSGISIVPLGGRHVNHFWRLLDNLQIPHITLLDLDREREGGAWGRIAYVMQQLILNGYPRDKILQTDSGLLSDTEFRKMKDWDVSEIKAMQTWIDLLETKNIFFSSPLDIDFLMLEHFGQEYKQILESTEGPRVNITNDDKSVITKRIIEVEGKPDESIEYINRVLADVKKTLKECGTNGDTYNDEQKKLMVWYNYFFLNRGKPSTHILALSQIDDSQLALRKPKVINRLINCANEILNPTSTKLK